MVAKHQIKIYTPMNTKPHPKVDDISKMGLYNEVRKGEARMHVPTAALLIARWGGATGPLIGRHVLTTIP